MPRGKRLNIPGAIYHIISRGIERRRIYDDEEDREEFLRRLSKGLEKTGSQCLGWTLMRNHFHIIIRTGESALSELMRKVLTGYAVYYNHRHRRSGHLFQNRYKSILCQEEIYLLALVQYIHLNPVRAGIVEDIKGLDKYNWAGHSAIVGKHKREWQEVDDVLRRFGETKDKAKAAYRKFMEEGMNLGRREELTGGGLRRSAGGWTGVRALKKMKENWRGDERILGDGDFVSEVLAAAEEMMNKKEKRKRDGWDVERLTEKVANEIGVTVEVIRSRGRALRVSKARAIISYLAVKELSLPGTVVARYFGLTKQAVDYLIKKGEKYVKEDSSFLAF